MQPPVSSILRQETHPLESSNPIQSPLGESIKTRPAMRRSDASSRRGVAPAWLRASRSGFVMEFHNIVDTSYLRGVAPQNKFQ